MTEFDKAFIKVSQLHTEERSALSTSVKHHRLDCGCDHVAFVPSQSENDAIAEMATFPDGTVTAEVIGLAGLSSLPPAASYFETGDGEYQSYMIETIDDEATVIETSDRHITHGEEEYKAESITEEIDNHCDGPTEVRIHDAPSTVPRPHLGFPMAKADLSTAELTKAGLVAQHPHKKADQRRISAAVLLGESNLATSERTTASIKMAPETNEFSSVGESTATETPDIDSQFHEPTTHAEAGTIEESETIEPEVENSQVAFEATERLPIATSIESPSYEWPAGLRQKLELASGPMGELAEQLIAWIKPPKCVIGILGCRPAAGSTTLTMGLGLELATRKIKTILVDADFTAPDLGNQLDTKDLPSWNDALSGNMPVENAILQGNNSTPSLLSLDSPVDPDKVDLEAFCHRANDHLSLLADRYDIVLVDLGSIMLESHQHTESTTCLDGKHKSADEVMQESIRLLGPRLDTVLLVNDQEDSDELLDRCCELLEQSAITPLGIVENFANSAL